MTPTEQEIKFFTSEEAKRIQELRPESLIDEWVGAGDVWIPRPQQLWEMLEEATGREEGQIGLEGPYPTPQVRYGVSISSEKGYIYHEGPTLSVTLGRALIEVLKEEQDV